MSKSSRRNQFVGGGTGSILSGAWGVYSLLTTAKDLPDDIGWVAEMIADPPVYAPWLLFGICVLFLAWVFWKRDDEPDEGGDSSSTTGPNSPIVGGNISDSAIGDNAKIMGDDNRKGFFNSASNHGSQVYNERPQPWKMNDIIAAKTMAILQNRDSPCTNRIGVMSHGGPASDNARDILADYLRSHGWTVAHVGWKQMMVPEPPGAVLFIKVGGITEIVIDCYKEMPDATEFGN